jgi:hypothetical protein
LIALWLLFIIVWESDPEMDTQEIKEAILFKKEPLSTYHIKVNKASQAICANRVC